MILLVIPSVRTMTAPFGLTWLEATLRSNLIDISLLKTLGSKCLGDSRS